ncbi:hypothetical protein TIFTF001_011314 [Ficus carica]|uniref:Uncharacterized protein n=1 Tax=Ficus carica TaxID=3494 RepID=A0AA88ALE0_FICCA|nr:hypothetical protein TIFTF001_011314 [Ficus carica]
MATVLEKTHVFPSTVSSDSFTNFSLPLTFCDTLWFKFPPVERLFFYSLPQPKPTFLISTLPKLKHSLSLTLLHFLPLAGNLTWPPDSPKPTILYTPNDGVPLTVAASDADFDLISGDHVRQALLLHPFVPKLNITETGASAIALQITLFPDRGFCIGATCHHAVLDGKSSTMFMKSWAHFCRSETPVLPPELTPFYDRSFIKDPNGVVMSNLNLWLGLTGTSNPKDDPNLFQFFPFQDVSSDSVRGTFELTRADIAKLREKVLSTWEKRQPTGTESVKPPYLTSFVLTLSHMLVCFLKTREEDKDDHEIKRKITFGFTADLRSRLRPPVPENYFGNCVGFLVDSEDKRGVLKEEEPLAAMAGKVGELMKELVEKDVLESATETQRKLSTLLSEGTVIVGVAGSPRLGVYGVDFGWGQPKKVEVVSIDRTEAFSMAESRDGSGGIEIGIVLKKRQMDVFSSLFLTGLQIHHHV